jgi:hypothetical protein
MPRRSGGRGRPGGAELLTHLLWCSSSSDTTVLEHHNNIGQTLHNIHAVRRDQESTRRALLFNYLHQVGGALHVKAIKRLIKEK